MGRIYYLEGSRAVGKTTLLRLIRKHNPGIAVIDGFSRREFNFDMGRWEEFVLNEQLYLGCAHVQYELLKKSPFHAVIVKGPYTDLYFAKTQARIAFPHNDIMKTPLAEQVDAIERCVPDGIVWLDAPLETILERCRKDDHVRSTMNTFVSTWLAGFREHYVEERRASVINTFAKTPEQVYDEFMRVIQG